MSDDEREALDRLIRRNNELYMETERLKREIEMGDAKNRALREENDELRKENARLKKARTT